MKIRRFLQILFAVLFSVLFIVLVGCGVFYVSYSPSLTADFAESTGSVTSGASGYLYGIAEDSIPSYNMTESVDISTVSQKVAGGLQHPVGDINNVQNQLKNTKYNVVYLQDDYDTWYYANDQIFKARKNSQYDWQTFIKEDYFPRVTKAVKEISKSSYAGKTVYCLYNECDNGVWFGTTVKDESNKEYGIRAEYDDAGKKAFYSAWKQTYNLVKSIDSNALIGGPGFFEYNHDKISDFLDFCKKNNCVPDVMIYHELSDNSVYNWQDNVTDYRDIEKSHSIDKMPIIVTEYGRMCDNGLPGKMMQYITQIESSKVFADNAFWRLANNLCDVAADDNSPNSNWWLYRWYADLEGSTVSSTYSDIMRSNVGKWLKGESKLRSKGFMGIVTMNDEKNKIEVLCSGRSGDARVVLKNLENTALDGEIVHISIEETVYQGLSGIVSSPTVISDYTQAVAGGKVVIKLTGLDEGNAYHIKVTKSDSTEITSMKNSNLPKRYEFENGTLLGNAYTYDSAYATTGEENGMVGGIEKKGDGVKTEFTVSDDGQYDLALIYGKSNDGKNSNNRVSGKATVVIDGKKSVITLNNTIKSEYTDCYHIYVDLLSGKHTIKLEYNDGTFVVDSLLVKMVDTDGNITVLPDADRTNKNNQSFLAVADSDGYYDLTAAKSVSFSVDGAKAYTNNDAKATVYLRRGLNYLDFKAKSKINCNISKSQSSESVAEITADKMAILNGAKAKTNNGIAYVDGITSASGSAVFKINAPKTDTYKMTILYSNNDEGGYHDYNVDLIERYVTVSNGKDTKDVWCRNTYSWETYKTVSTNINLNKGSNTVTLSNSGKTKFNLATSKAPRIAKIIISKTQL